MSMNLSIETFYFKGWLFFKYKFNSRVKYIYMHTSVPDTQIYMYQLNLTTPLASPQCKTQMQSSLSKHITCFVRNPGVEFDSRLNFEFHTNKAIQSWFYRSRNVCKDPEYLILHVFISSYLDYYNAVLPGISQKEILNSKCIHNSKLYWMNVRTPQLWQNLFLLLQCLWKPSFIKWLSCHANKGLYVRAADGLKLWTYGQTTKRLSCSSSQTRKAF